VTNTHIILAFISPTVPVLQFKTENLVSHDQFPNFGNLVFWIYRLFIFKQRQLSEIQKNFINNLDHEFKTPIASIGLSAKVLENPSISEQPERLHEYAKIISQQNKRLSAQVEKLLQMASIERTKLQLNIQKIELCTFIPDTIQEFKNSQNGNKYQINFSNQAGEKASIKADPLHFSNLIFNIRITPSNIVMKSHHSTDFK
jgi:two-component system phosphate regulon sensor histidine kinase PhoR